MSTHSPSACYNCGATLQGRFCVVCGQEDRPLDPTVGEVVGEFARELSDLDGRILRSVRHLFFSPGLLTKEHFRGRRASWISPVRLYLVCSVAYFAILSLTGLPPLNFNFQVTSETDEESKQAVQELGFSSEEEIRTTANEALVTWIPRAMFVLIPLFAWLLSRVRRKSGHRYPHHLIFSLHLFAAFFAVLAIGVGVSYLARNEIVSGVIGLGSIVFVVIYMMLALKVVYGGTSLRALIHTAVVLSAYWLATIVVTGAIIAPVLFWRRK